MFPAPLPVDFERPLGASPRPADTGVGGVAPKGGVLGWLGVLCLLALGLPAEVSAQALGTMQVSARVSPSPAAWTGLTEARRAIASAVHQSATLPQIRRGSLIQTRAEILPTEGRPLLVVTIHHPQN